MWRGGKSFRERRDLARACGYGKLRLCCCCWRPAAAAEDGQTCAVVHTPHVHVVDAHQHAAYLDTCNCRRTVFNDPAYRMGRFADQCKTDLAR